LEDGLFDSRAISQKEAQEWLSQGPVENFCGHQTVRLFGLEPDRDRFHQAKGYDEALALKAKARLEFGREYTLEEIQAIGVEFRLTRKVG